MMDAVVDFININQNKVVKRLTSVSVILLPLNVLAGIGDMSEYSMMTQTIPWPISYSIFTMGLVIVGWFTFVILRFLENLEYGKSGKHELILFKLEYESFCIVLFPQKAAPYKNRQISSRYWKSPVPGGFK